MLSQVHSFVLQGIDAQPCEVEVDINEAGMPRTTVVGLPDAAVKESVERVRSALANSGYPFPFSRLLVNLAPADIRKEGPCYDLPIAVGLLLAQDIITTSDHERLLLAGELALDGRVRPVSGVVNMALLARQRGYEGIVVPTANAREAAAVDGLRVYAADNLTAVVAHLNRTQPMQPLPYVDARALLVNDVPAVDFLDVRGQEAAKRAMCVAAAGGHNILMIGPAGTGKTMMAKALAGILPPLTPEEALAVTRIYSCIGAVPRDKPLVTSRPVRTPHHTASQAAIIGGGTVPRPGEVSLAHHGVLFLDEMPEFPRMVLETLRQPMEDGDVTIARAQGSVRFPARFMLVAAMNPTPKGGMPVDAYGHRQMTRYLARLSGPLVDRIDIHVEVPAVPHQQLMSRPTGTTTAQLREQVIRARQVQTDRQQGSPLPNAQLSGRMLDAQVCMDDAAVLILREAMTSLGLSARAYDKIRRVSRTIADLEGCPQVRAEHVAEAVQYRLLDRQTSAYALAD